MALSVRLRRAVLLSSSIFKDCSYSSIASSSSHLTLSKILCPAASCLENPILRLPLQTQSSSFHSSISRFVGRYDRDPGSKIPEDEILFEGCDYNHWLITMDFPKDPKPTPEEMVETYVQTLAKVVGSVEEAKKKMYACSTTTYQGFQAVMSEEMSEKFRGLPGVVFILPDSYIDPVNKEYGGDKYDNGVITPRPPPIQYGRQGRYGDGNRRRYDQPRYDRQRSPPAQSQNEYQQMNQGNPANNEYQGPGQGYGRGYTPQQNQGPPGQDGRGYGPPGQDARSYGPPGQDGRSYGPPGQDGRSYGPPGQEGRSYGPPGDTPQQGYYSPMRQEGNAQQGYGRNYGPPQGYNPQNMQQGYGRNYGQPQNYGPPPQNNYGPPPGQEGNSFGRPPTDAQQGYTPMPRGNPQGQQQQGNPQVQPENKPYYGNQDADGASAPYGGEGRG